MVPKLSFILFLTLSFFSLSQKNPSDLNYIQSIFFQPYKTQSSVGKFEKIEFGFKLTDGVQKQIKTFISKNDTSGINPYDPDHINFEAIFISPTGVQTKRYGFYYQPFTENLTFDKWDSDTTSFPWRVRFAPDEIGDWNVKIEVHSKNLTTSIKTELAFSCIPSNHKGVLKTSNTGTESDRYLSYSETGETFVAISNNISSGGFFTYKPSQNNRQMKGVQQLIDVGGNFTRFDMQPQAALPDWPVYNNYNGKQDEMYGFDRMVELCEKNGVYFIVFRHHVELMDSYYNPEGSDWSGVSWFDNPYRIGLMLSRKVEYLTNEEAIEWQLKSLRYVFSRWGYSPSFSFYGYSEINNWYSGIVKDEHKIDSKFDDEEALIIFSDWFINQKNYIKSNLSKNILFSNSFSSVPEIETNSNFNGMLRNSDVVSIHNYEVVKDVNFKGRYTSVEKFWKIYHKPVIIEEMGVSDNKLRIYCCTGIEYHNSIWATSLMGSFGTGMDWWWDRGVHDFGYYTDLRQINSFFKGENLGALNYKPQKWSDETKVGKRTIENYALVSENQERALGWVHNATFYWRNLYNESPCIQEIVGKNQLNYPCIVGEGYDINTEGMGDYNGERFEDDFTLNGGAIPISNTNIENNPTFKISGLKKNLGSKKHWYKIEFYYTIGKDYKINATSTQIVSTNIFSSINPHVPNLDKLNPDYSYKVTYLGKSKTMMKK